MVPRCLASSALLFLLGSLGCDSAQSVAGPSEPWLKDEVVLGRTARQFVRYRATPRQELQFSVQTKQGSLRGSIPVLEAEFELDAQALDSTHGTLVFDLERLTLARAGEDSEEGAASSADLLLTEAARLWLGLGVAASREQRADAGRARFEVRLGRELSSHSAQGGSVVSSPRASGAVRRVAGIVEGDLLVLGREVTHVVAAEVDFTFAPGQGVRGVPDRLSVRLTQPEAVPLAEHGIAPRDARGAIVTEQQAALGRAPGLRAVVTGQLRFERRNESESLAADESLPSTVPR